MNITLKILRAIFAAIAVFIILGSQGMQHSAPPSDPTFPMLNAFLVFFSVAFLHRLLVRYITATDLVPAEERDQLLAVGESAAQRGFFGGTASIGYLLVFLYCGSVAGFPFLVAEMTPLGLGCSCFPIGLAAYFLLADDTLGQSNGGSNIIPGSLSAMYCSKARSREPVYHSSLGRRSSLRPSRRFY